MELQVKDDRIATPIAVTALAFPEEEVDNLYIGSEKGVVYHVVRHGPESGVQESFHNHFGPITSLSFHPRSKDFDFADLFLSSSTDWSCKLWTTKRPDKPLASFESTDYVYGCAWSPHHPALFAVIDGNGFLTLWNLNEALETPVLKKKISERALNTLQWSDPESGPKCIMVGDATGTTFVYELGEMYEPKDEDKKRFADTLETMRAA